MIPREEHIKQVNRFHDYMEQLSAEFKKGYDDRTQLDIGMKYMKMLVVWDHLNNSMEILKDKIDSIQKLKP